MPLKSYNKKIDHDLGIPLQDDYFYDEPEEIIENKDMPQLESTAKVVGHIAKKGEKRIINADVLIVGAGISGMQAALDVADKGYKVVIIDKTSTIGGAMVKLDKTFPTNDCSICTAAPKMVELSRHPNINLITYAEVNSLEGKPGDFKINVWRKSKYVDPDKCTGCDDCAEVCPVDVINPFDEKLTTRKAIYIEFPQAVPIVYTIDFENCIGCGSCDRVCEPEAISFLEKSEEIEVNVGSVIDPVITTKSSVAAARIISAAGMLVAKVMVGLGVDPVSVDPLSLEEEEQLVRKTMTIEIKNNEIKLRFMAFIWLMSSKDNVNLE